MFALVQERTRLKMFQVHTAVQQPGFKRVKRGYKPLSVDNLVPLYQIKNPSNPGNRDPSDPYFQYQWYLKNTGQNGGKPKLDLNVKAAWAQGVTGKNVTTAIMDDGEIPIVRVLFLNYFKMHSIRNWILQFSWGDFSQFNKFYSWNLEILIIESFFFFDFRLYDTWMSRLRFVLISRHFNLS